MNFWGFKKSWKDDSSQAGGEVRSTEPLQKMNYTKIKVPKVRQKISRQKNYQQTTFIELFFYICIWIEVTLSDTYWK